MEIGSGICAAFIPTPISGVLKRIIMFDNKTNVQMGYSTERGVASESGYDIDGK